MRLLLPLPWQQWKWVRIIDKKVVVYFQSLGTEAEAQGTQQWITFWKRIPAGNLKGSRFLKRSANFSLVWSIKLIYLIKLMRWALQPTMRSWEESRPYSIWEPWQGLKGLQHQCDLGNMEQRLRTARALLACGTMTVYKNCPQASRPDLPSGKAAATASTTC